MKEVRRIKQLSKNPDYVFRLVRKMKVECTDVVGGRCMRGNDVTLFINEMDRAKLWKARKSKIMIEEDE